MSGSTLFKRLHAHFPVADAIALVIAGAILGLIVANIRPANAQGLEYLSRSYITPFPEENQYRLYVLGDSLGDGIWAGLYRAFKDDAGVEVVKRSRVSTGFVRTDYFDWNATLKSILRAEKVHIAVVMMGANDMQPIRVNKTWHKVGSEKWREIYGQRVDKFIKQLKQANVAVYWVGLPIMRSPKHNEDMQVMNEIFRERAFINSVKFVDTWNGFTDQFGRYSAYGPDLSGQVRRLRAGDGIHFTIRGYRKLAHFVEREIRRDLRQARSDRDIPLAGGEAEQNRAVGRSRASRSRKGANAARSGGRQGRRESGEAAEKKNIRRHQETAQKSAIPSEGVALPEESTTVGGIKLLRPRISEAALAAAGTGYVPEGEFIPGDLPGGVTALSSVSPVSDGDLASAQQHLPLTQRPYYRVFVKGEELKPKPGRADDFSWPASEKPGS